MMTPGEYTASFEILSSDFRRLLEYVEPTDANLSAYSHRAYELILRSCTDFESVCKELLMAASYPKAANHLTVTDYKTLETSLHLEEIEVGLPFWRPATVYLRPFDTWSTSTPPLDWYSAYNRVKHNRVAEFPRANLDNTRHALAGLFAVLWQAGAFPTGSGSRIRVLNRATHNEHVLPGLIFTLQLPKPPAPP